MVGVVEERRRGSLVCQASSDPDRGARKLPRFINPSVQTSVQLYTTAMRRRGGLGRAERKGKGGGGNKPPKPHERLLSPSLPVAGIGSMTEATQPGPRQHRYYVGQDTRV